MVDGTAAVAEAVEKNWAGHQGHLGQQVQKHDSERSGKNMNCEEQKIWLHTNITAITLKINMKSEKIRVRTKK